MKHLNNFLNDNEILLEELAGFRDGYNTTDHQFTLDFICNYYVKQGERLYIAFVDYKKAFDSLDRSLLWSKVLTLNIRGPVLNVMYNLYNNAKSYVKYDGKLSYSFLCNVGVRQGECLSPLLFAIFLNNLIPHINQCCDGANEFGANMSAKLFGIDIGNYVKLGILLNK